MAQSFQDREYWDHHWKNYEQVTQNNPAQSYRRKLVLDLLQIAQKGADTRLLDIGSGQGDAAADLTRLYPQLQFLGLELSISGVEVSRKKVPTANFVQRNLLESQDPPQEFHNWATHAICMEVLEHIDEPESLLRNVLPYLAPGARLVITVPGGPRTYFDKHIGHRRHYNRAGLRALVEKSGYEVEVISGAGFPFFNIYKLVVMARGKKLVTDVTDDQQGRKLPLSARVAMGTFDQLFRLNADHGPFGWQLVALVRKPLV